MPRRRPLDLWRLERRTTVGGLAEAEGTSALARRQRRPVFGPLLYSTLVVAAIVMTFIAALRLGGVVDGELDQPIAVSPDTLVASNIGNLENERWETRFASAKALGDALLQYGPGDINAGYRGDALLALRKVLGDPAAPVRAQAAEILGNSPQFGRLATAELILAMDDSDPSVRLAAARALLQVKPNSPGPALRVLSALLTDPAPSSDRLTIVILMRSEGGISGAENAAKALVSMLSSSNDVLRLDGLKCIAALGYDAPQLLPDLEPLLDSADLDTRCTAAVAVARLTADSIPPPAWLIGCVADALTNVALPASLREEALQQLYRLSPSSLGRCGRALARQLDHQDFQVRLEAATLLHTIDIEALADKDGTLPDVDR
jgi:hypothetical protein